VLRVRIGFTVADAQQRVPTLEFFTAPGERGQGESIGFKTRAGYFNASAPALAIWLSC